MSPLRVPRPLDRTPARRTLAAGAALATAVLAAVPLASAPAGAAASTAAATTATATAATGAPAAGRSAVRSVRRLGERPGQGGAASHGPRAGSGTTYYVAADGSDAASGTSTRTPLRSLDAVSRLGLRAGDRILLQRGGTFPGRLDVSESGVAGDRIRIGSFGDAARPLPRLTGGCVLLTGDWITVTGIQVDGCDRGILTIGGHVTIRRITATHNMHGVEVGEGATDTRVLRSTFTDNNRMAPNTPGAWDDYGAVGVVVAGDRTEVAYNTISGGVAPSEDFGTDGSAVEIYGGIGTSVHHNVARDNRTFTELGNKRSADTTYAYNVSTSSLANSEFLITRGGEDYFGPVARTVARNNTVRNTGPGSQGFYCYGGCSPAVLSLSNNILDIAGRIGYADGPIGGSGNLYWGGALETPLLPGDRYADPDFLSRSDLRVASDSPAVDRVTAPPMKRDILGRPVPIDGDGDGRAAADIGAYETVR